MGTVESDRPPAEAVRDAAISAALHDPRFSPVTLAELPELTIEVSLLSPPEPMTRLEQIELGRHGVIVCRGEQRGLFLPQVAVEHGLDREAFLTRCCVEKAGLSADAWRDPQTEVLLFTTRVFREEPRRP
jgi:AmmeMemoRadiSam system protein A